MIERDSLIYLRWIFFITFFSQGCVSYLIYLRKRFFNLFNIFLYSDTMYTAMIIVIYEKCIIKFVYI